MKEKQPEALQQFLQRVKDEIRSKEAKIFVERELQAHLSYRTSELIEQGYSKEAAEKIAIENMGNPISLGKEMHKIHKPKIDWFLLGLFAMVLLVGTVPYYFLSFEAFQSMQPHFFQRQLIWSLLTIIIVIAFMYFDYRILKTFWTWLLAIALILTLAMELFGVSINGQSYLSVSSFSITYWTISLFYIGSFVGNLSSKIGNKKQIAAILFIFWLPIYIFLKGAYLPLALFYFITLLVIILVSPLSNTLIKRLVILKGVFLALAIPLFFMTAKPHQIDRIYGFLNPEKDPQGVGWIYLQLQEIVQNAQFISSNEVVINLPDMHVGFIFASLLYSFGWLVGIIIILILGMLLYRMLYIVKKTKDPLGKMIVYAGVSFVGLAVLWNILMVLGMLPIIGIGLPFISYGGQSNFMYAVFLGLILSVYRRKDQVLAQSY